MANASPSMGIAARGCFGLSHMQLCILLAANGHNVPAAATASTLLVYPASTVLGGQTPMT